MRKIAIPLFSLALLFTPCSCGDDDSDVDNRQEVNKDDPEKGKSGDQKGKEDDSKKTPAFECEIEPLKRTLYFAGEDEDELNVYVRSNRSLSDLTVYVEDEVGKRYEVRKEVFYNYFRVYSPNVVGNLTLVVADTDGSHPKRVAFYNLDAEKSRSIQTDMEKPYVNLRSGESFSRVEANVQPGAAWLKLDPEKGIVGTAEVSVVFDDGKSSLDQIGEVRQFKLSNGQEGLIVLVLITYKEGKKDGFAFSYCLK